MTTLILSCGQAKKETEKTPAATERKGDVMIPDSEGPDAGATLKPDDSLANLPDKNEILSKIDQYLVSDPVYKNGPAGISNAVITVTNKLNDITFQKAIVEVALLDAAGKTIRTDFYTIQNVEPGDIETIKLPVSLSGNTLRSHIVKVKSDALTDGEMILVGSAYESIR
jgi:hypothetical protein